MLWTAFFTFIFIARLANAYITDIKLVSCDIKYACPNYPGYRKIPVDLNLGVKGTKSVFMHLKEDPHDNPITELQIVQGSNTSSISNISKWNKLNVNLNDGQSEETSLWLYYTKDTSISSNPVTSIIIKEGSSPIVSAEYKRIPVDLNSDVGGYHLFMFYSQDGMKGTLDERYNLSFTYFL